MSDWAMERAQEIVARISEMPTLLQREFAEDAIAAALVEAREVGREEQRLIAFRIFGPSDNAQIHRLVAAAQQVCVIGDVPEWYRESPAFHSAREKLETALREIEGET